MGAFDLLNHFRERGLTIEPGEPGRLTVSPSNKLTDDDRAQIRAHKAELLDALVGIKAAAPARPRTTTSCATCTHSTKARTCSEPEAAGLVDRFRIVWLDSIGTHGATCPAHQSREQRQPFETVPRLTAEQQHAVVGWSDAEIATVGRYMQQAARHGYEVEIAERIASHLILRDRQGDTRRMCVECTHLTPVGRCNAARAGRLAGAGRDLEPVKVELMNCPSFTAAFRD